MTGTINAVSRQPNGEVEAGYIVFIDINQYQPLKGQYYNKLKHFDSNNILILVKKGVVFGKLHNQ